MDLRVTTLDRAIAWIAPQAGLRRLHARAAFAASTRAYEGAKHSRTTQGWRATGASANSEIGPALATLRNRCRDLERNNPIAMATGDQFSGRVVGAGITPRPKHPSKRVREQAMDAWNRFVERSDAEGIQDHYAQQNLGVRTMFRDGEVLAVWLPDESGPNAQVRLLEVDHLDMARRETAGSTDRIVHGIEIDEWGRRRGYWLHPVHPGEMDVRRRRFESRFVPAHEVDHLFHVTRPGQARGVPWLAPAMLTIQAIGDLKEAIQVRRRLEACIGLVYTSPDGHGHKPIAGEQSRGRTGLVEEAMRPGMILRGGPGESVTSFAPAPSDGFTEHLQSELYSICAVAGSPYHAVTGDTTRANYTGLRAAELAGHVLLDVVQWHDVIPRFCRPAWRRVMAREAMLRNNGSFLACDADWSPPPRPWVDPVKEVSAKIAEIRAGLCAMPDALAERGLDWQAHLAEIQAFLAAVDEAGLAFDTDARRVNGSGALQQLAGQPEQPQTTKD